MALIQIVIVLMTIASVMREQTLSIPQACSAPQIDRVREKGASEHPFLIVVTSLRAVNNFLGKRSNAGA